MAPINLAFFPKHPEKNSKKIRFLSYIAEATNMASCWISSKLLKIRVFDQLVRPVCTDYTGSVGVYALN